MTLVYLHKFALYTATNVLVGGKLWTDIPIYTANSNSRVKLLPDGMTRGLAKPTYNITTLHQDSIKELPTLIGMLEVSYIPASKNIWSAIINWNKFQSKYCVRDITLAPF